MENICLVDNTVHESLDALHSHLRKFKIKMLDYYEQYYPRKDLMTQEVIPFKSIDTYFATYFLNKYNMKTWYKKHPEEAAKLSMEMLKSRIEKKKLKKLPTEVELISAGLPSSQYYYKYIKEDIIKAGFQTSYNYDVESLNFDQSKLDIIIDSREQTPLKLKGVNTISQGLNFGDYAILGGENAIVIERKALSDLISSCVTNFDRFRREFDRAKEAGAYMIVLCEESLNTALSYPFIPYFKKYTKIRPEAVFYNIRQLIQDYDCQFLFCDGRVKSAEVLIKLFQLRDTVKTIDLQWALDRAKLL